MPITMLDAVEFSKIPALQFVVPVVSADPAGYEAGFIYNSTTKEVKFHNGTSWIALGPAGAGGPPTGGAGGDLTGSYPAPTIVADAVTNAKLANMAASSIKGNNAGTISDPTDLSIAQVKTLLALAKGDVGLGNVDNTADTAKPVSTAVTTALSGKADTTTDHIAGAGLTGGGTLAASRTFDVGAGTGITVAADSVAVNRTVTDTWYQAAGSAGGAAGGDLTGTYPNPQIAAGVIVDADVNASAGISTSKIFNLDNILAGKASTANDMAAGAGLTGGGTLAANRTFNVGAGTGITVNADDVALNLTYTDARYLQLAGGTLTNFLTLHADPTAPTHAATKQYVDLASQGLDFKNSVRAASTANLTLSAPQTVDGIALIANDRVLVKDQTTPAQNGIYLVAAGAWTRTTDADASGEISDGTLVPVEGGTTQSDTLWLCTATGATPWVPGTSTSTWTRYGSAADIAAGAGMLKTGATLDIVSATADLSVGADSVTVVSAPKWTTGRVITLTGDVTATSTAFDGSAALSIATTVVQAPRWTTGRTITLTGDVTGASAAFDGTGNLSFATALAAGSVVDLDVSATANIAQSKIASLTTDLAARVLTTRQVIAGNGLTGGGALSADVTLNVVGDSNMTVAADAISILSAPKWTTPRSITLTGDVTGTIASVDGSANISIATTAVGAGAAAKHFAGDVPAGTTCTITHSLNTRDVVVSVHRNSTPWDTVLCDVRRTTVNTVDLIFASAVTAAAYRCVVTGK